MAALLFSLSVGLFTFTLLSVLLGRRARLRIRLQTVMAGKGLGAADADDPRTAGDAEPRNRNRSRDTAGMPEAASRRRHSILSPYFGKIGRELAAAGIELSRREQRILAGGAVGVSCLVGFLAHNGVAGILALLGCGAGFRLWIHRRVSLRRKEFDAGLGDMLTIAASALRAGYSFLQAVDMLASETKGRMAEEWKRVLREMTLGVTVEDALTHAAARVESADFELVVNAVLIQRQIGGNLAEVLDTTGETIRDRLRIRGEIRALTAQGRMSMWIFVVLTPGIALVLYALNPSYISVLWQEQAGILMLAGAAVGQVLGTWLIRRIVSIEV
jgi:tight adherence protein B